MITTLHLLISAVMALYSVNWVFMKVLKIAKVKGLVDNPNARKLQKTPVPVLGGIAVFFGLLMGLLSYVAVGMMLDAEIGETARLLPVVLAASVMLYVGCLDDVLGLTPRSRIVIEALAMLGVVYGTEICIDSLHGLWGIGQFSWWIGVPLTVFAGVGIINAVNMVDGVNGLSSGLCIVISCFMACFFFEMGFVASAALSLCSAAALVPFLLHNVVGLRSKMFIGDGGTMVMGLLMSWYVIRTLSDETVLTAGLEGACLPAMLTAVFCVPVGDTLRVMTMRMLKGRSPFSADKTHLHHVLIRYSGSHSITSLTEIAICIIVTLCWMLSWKAGCSLWLQMLVVICLAALLVVGSYFILDRSDRMHTGIAYMLRRVMAKGRQGKKSWWTALQRWLDRGAYEDFAQTLAQIRNKRLEEMSREEKELVEVVNYLQCRRSVTLTELMQETGLDENHLNEALVTLVDEDRVAVTARTPEGLPLSVRYVEK